MSELNKKKLEENNNQLFFDSMKTEINDKKLDFIKNVVTRIDIPANFVRIKNSPTGEELFHTFVNGEKHRREWLFLQDSHFFCVYCICFSKQNGTNIFANGVEYKPKCRISQKLKLHENESHHNLAKSTYLSLVGNSISGEGVQKRNVIKIILKVIIYISTHGK